MNRTSPSAQNASMAHPSSWSTTSRPRMPLLSLPTDDHLRPQRPQLQTLPNGDHSPIPPPRHRWSRLGDAKERSPVTQDEQPKPLHSLPKDDHPTPRQKWARREDAKERSTVVAAAAKEEPKLEVVSQLPDGRGGSILTYRKSDGTIKSLVTYDRDFMLAMASAMKVETELDGEKSTSITTCMKHFTCMWYYLDPAGGEHGPYEAPQMLIWLKSGFFQEHLRCRCSKDQPFTTLGELILMNGRDNPFVYPKPQPIASIPSDIVKNSNHLIAPPPGYLWQTPDLHESQRALLEEKRRLEQMHEVLRHEEHERMERERRVHEMELEVERKQDELQKMAMAKEEELERKRRLLADYEMKAHQEAEKRMAAQKMEETTGTRRMHEMFEKEQHELEEAKRNAEELFLVKQKLAAEEARRVHENVMFEARRLADEAERQRNEKLERERKQQEEHLLIRSQHMKRLTDQQKRREEEEAAAAAHARLAGAKAPWAASSRIHQEKPHVLPAVHPRSLLEIQLEEEKALEEKRRKEQELFEYHRKQAVTFDPWAGTPAATVPSPPGVNKAGWNDNSAAAASLANYVRANPAIDDAWPAIPPPVTTPKKKKEQPKIAAAAQPKKKKAAEQPQPKQDDSQSEFKKWVIKGIKDLNKSVDASVDPEMFFGFIKNIIDPVDVEDYFVTYFGDKAEVKIFQKKFLEKRIALRSNQKESDKDDLSAAQAAVNVPSPTTIAATDGKKKKKGKGQIKTVDLAVLGFKAGGDPNRINVGEIDLEPPISIKKKH